MARNIDVFGFDELEKAMKQCEKNYPSQADAFLMAEGRAVNKRTKSLTPVRTKKLRSSWRTKKVKLYKGGKVRVVRVQSTAPHAHLIELGHKIVSGGRTRERGRKLNRVQRSARGIKSGGYVQGDFMLEKSMSEAQAKFNSGAEKLLDKITKDIQTRTAEILANAGFNVVASEVDEGFLKPAVFVSAYPSDVQPQCCGGALEELTVSVELKYISALETVEDCIGAYSRIKELFLYPTFDIMDRHLTIHEMNFEIEKGVMYVYFDINFIQAVDKTEKYDEMSELVIRGDKNGVT